jgi:hypothetical protein
MIPIYHKQTEPDNHLAGSTIERYSLGGRYLPKLSAQ